MYLVNYLLCSLFIQNSFARCPNFCSGHGKCLADSTCECYRGWGSVFDITDYRSHDCSLRVCKYGLSWGSVPDFNGNGHLSNAECSGIGICNRETGICKCPSGYRGGACEKRTCPNNCSGHGRCVTMRNLARLEDAFPLSEYNYTYGSVSLNDTETWDADKIQGCVCDSAWTVGLGSNETQEAEWFGADCSLRHCPSADDPLTSIVETDCYNVTSSNGNVGKFGNLCHVDCANRGLCDFRTGECHCFQNFYGLDCSLQSSLAVND